MDFEEIVHTYSKHIYQTAYLYTKNRQVAEDITQDVLLSFYKKQSQFRQEASLKTYFTTLTYNRCHDYRRSWKNKTHEWLEKFTFRSRLSVEKQVTDQARKQDILNAVMSLPVIYREVIILYYFNELKGREIAEVLQCSENTVHTRLKRAKELLSKDLHDWEVTMDEEATGKRN